MKQTTLKLNDYSIKAKDYRNIVVDYRELIHLKPTDKRPVYIPKIDINLFYDLCMSLPVVKIDDFTYLFPTNVSFKARGRSTDIKLSDFSDFCVVDIDLLVATQNYYFHKTKNEYVETTSNTKKIRRDHMNYPQYNLAMLIYKDKKVCWDIHKELQDEIIFKNTDHKLQRKDNESTYTKGEYTSYGRVNTNDGLLSTYGVTVKLQNGKPIKAVDIDLIRRKLNVFFNSVINCKSLFAEYKLLISFSQDTRMHASRFIGIFHPTFHAIGISNISNIDRTLAHEIGHFLDFIMGEEGLRFFASDDKSHLAGQIAFLFRNNMREKTTSEYKNRTKECFARALDQYYCIKNSILIGPGETDFCDDNFFVMRIEPLINKLIQEMLTNVKK